MIRNPWATCWICGERWMARNLVHGSCPWCRAPGPKAAPPLPPQDPALLRLLEPVRYPRTAMCLVCRRPFPTARSHAKTCSPACRQKLRRILLREARRCRDCEACVRQFQAQRSTARFCSDRCRLRVWRMDRYMMRLLWKYRAVLNTGRY